MMFRGFLLEAVLFVRAMNTDPQAALPLPGTIILSIFDFDMWLDVRSWHGADKSIRHLRGRLQPIADIGRGLLNSLRGQSRNP